MRAADGADGPVAQPELPREGLRVVEDADERRGEMLLGVDARVVAVRGTRHTEGGVTNPHGRCGDAPVRGGLEHPRDGARV